MSIPEATKSGYCDIDQGDCVDLSKPNSNTMSKDNLIAQPIGTTDGRARTVKAQYSKNSLANFVEDAKYPATGVAEPVRVWTYPRTDGVQTQGQAFRVYSDDGKACGLKGCAGGSGGKTGLYAIESEESDTPVYTVRDGQIEFNGRTYPIKLRDGKYIIRKLTVDECKRLQTVPEWYDFSCVSDSQAYKMLGNGWTCDVITHLIKSCLEDYENNEGLSESR